MPPAHRRVVAAPLVLLAALALLVTGCGGEPDLAIGQARAGVPAGGAALVSLEVTNHGDAADRLVDLETDAAGDVEVHRTEIDDGQARMGEVDEVEIPAGETVTFRPGGLHLMLVLPGEAVVEGGTFELVLHFARAGERTVEVEVVPTADLADDALPE